MNEINIDDIKDFTQIPNRISEILKEENISPIILQSDLEEMHLSSMEQWNRLLRGEEQLLFIDAPDGRKENLFAVSHWLGVNLCDLHGMCFGTDGEKQDCDYLKCNSQDRWKKIVGMKSVQKCHERMGEQILDKIIDDKNSEL